MCIVVDADCIVANLFAAGRKSVTFTELRQFRARLERKIPQLYIDISTDAISSAVEHRPDMFVWTAGQILRREGAGAQLFSRDYVDANFNWRIPDSYRDDVLQILTSR